MANERRGKPQSLSKQLNVSKWNCGSKEYYLLNGNNI